MKLKSIPAIVCWLILFIILALPRAYARVGAGPFYIVITAGNFGLDIIDIQFASNGEPVGPLYPIWQEIPDGTTKTFGPFTPGDNPNSLEVTYRFDWTTYTYIIPSDWAEKGLELSKRYTLITAIGEPLTYPLLENPVEGDTTIMVISYTLTISTTTGGTTSPSPGTYTYSYETVVTITALPGIDYKLDYWELDGSNVEAANQISVTMNTNHVLKAFFVYAWPARAVGGVVVPVDKFGLLAPYIGLASTILAATVATTVYVKHVKRRKEKQ